MKKFSKVAITALLAVGLGARAFAGSTADGEFIGTRENAYYGYVQVVAVVKHGKLADVKITEFPHHAGRSQYISSVALPWLIHEAVKVQTSRVNLISGATMTSMAFTRSLDAALRKAGVWSPPMEQTEVLMGMPITVVVPSSRGIEPDKSAFEAVFESFQAIEEQFSPYKPGSEVSRISRGELTASEASPLMTEVLDLCRETEVLSDGWFTPWFEGKFDPSGLVKGWAIHRASRLLDGLGYRHHCIEAGGDIEVRGLNGEGLPWEIGIRNPFDTASLVKVLHLSDRGIATSGTYIRGRHIYNPKTGERIEGVPSLTVVGPNVYEADRFATPAYAMGEGGISWLARLPGIDAYQIGHNKTALATPGLSEYQHD